MDSFAPVGSRIHVRLTRPAEKSAGGIYIPETAERVTTEGTVLSTGPGTYLAELERREPVWFVDGDIILFPAHYFRRLEGDEGIIAEEDVVATVDPTDNSLLPEGDWVLVDPDPALSESMGGIALSDSAKRRPGSGVVRALGPGLLRFRGELVGFRNPVWRSLSLYTKEELLNKRVYWAGDAEVMRAAGKALVRGRDLLCLEAAESPEREKSPLP